ncbi:MAG: VanZ family protein [Fimbriimonadaceae bacterium]|nr:VanZ family protein [Fimbriimonadaceae bacterium]
MARSSNLLSILLAYAVAFLGCLLASEAADGTLALLAFGLGGGLLCALTLVRSRTRLLLPPLLLGLSIAVFSGSAGSSSPMRDWLLARGLSPEDVRQIVHAFRKSVHVAFYGAMAGTAFLGLRRVPRLAQPGAWALAWAMGHALVDEGRQLRTPGRTGQPLDLAIDLAGALAGLALAAWLLRRRRPKPARN